MTKDWRSYLQHDIWRIRLRKAPSRKLWFLRPIRVILLALRGFDEDGCQLRASALTFYTLLSVVPVLAMAFGVAKGFNLHENLQKVLVERMRGQEQVADWLIRFANAFLDNTQGGIVAGFGVVLLFWAVVKLLGNIESSFNYIWGVRSGRSMARSFSDYLSVMLIAPVLFMVASGTTVFITSQFDLLVQRFAILGSLAWLVSLLVSLLPFVLLWVLFTFLYIFMPNTNVSFRAALTAGIVAGTVYQLAQWIYVTFQIGVSKFNAVYGGFAALPLFLTWLQISWIVVLFGAEVSFAVDNEETYEFEPDCALASRHFKKKVALKLMELCVKSFDKGKGPLQARELAHALEAPIRLVREVVFDLAQAGLLIEVKAVPDSRESYHPAQPIDRITIQHVLEALDRSGRDHPFMLDAEQLKPIEAKLRDLSDAVEHAPANALLRDL